MEPSPKNSLAHFASQSTLPCLELSQDKVSKIIHDLLFSLSLTDLKLLERSCQSCKCSFGTLADLYHADFVSSIIYSAIEQKSYREKFAYVSDLVGKKQFKEALEVLFGIDDPQINSYKEELQRAILASYQAFEENGRELIEIKDSIFKLLESLIDGSSDLIEGNFLLSQKEYSNSIPPQESMPKSLGTNENLLRPLQPLSALNLTNPKNLNLTSPSFEKSFLQVSYAQCAESQEKVIPLSLTYSNREPTHMQEDLSINDSLNSNPIFGLASQPYPYLSLDEERLRLATEFLNAVEKHTPEPNAKF